MNNTKELNMNDLKKMETVVVPTLLKILNRDQVELSHNSSDPVWVQRQITELLNDDYMMTDFMANHFEKDGTYPEFKGLSISEILDEFLRYYLESCQMAAEEAAETLFTHGY
jgi:hypothetical protein